MAIEVYPNKKVSRPHTEIISDTSGIGGASSGSVKQLMIVGKAQGGKPNTVYRIRNYMQAKQTFRGGELLDAIELAWNPTPDSSLNNAGDILAMRVEDAVNAKLTKGGLTVTSNIYGTDSNDIQVSLEDNGTTDTKRLTVSFATDRYSQVFDNLGKIFSLKYTGEEAEATFSITKGRDGSKQLVLKAGETLDDGAPTVTKTYDLGSGVFTDTATLISDINNLPDFEAKFFPIGDKNVPTDTYEEADKVSIKTGGKVYVEALAGDISKQTAYNTYVTFSFDPETGIENFPLTKLAGGSNGKEPESWADKIQLFANEGGYYLVPLSPKQSIHAEALAFAGERTNNGEPMRVFVGGNQQESLDELVARSAGLRSDRANLVGFSGSRRMDDGRELKIPGYLLSAQVAGLASGLPVGESITFKSISLDKLDVVYDGSSLDQLNESGVICAEFVRNREATSYRIVQGVTTYNDRTAPVKNEIGVGEAHDFLVSDLKIKLDNAYIGTKAVETSSALIKNFIQSFLDGKKRSEEIADYDAEQVQVYLEGDVCYISMVITPVRSLNKIEVTLTYKQTILTA